MGSLACPQIPEHSFIEWGRGHSSTGYAYRYFISRATVVSVLSDVRWCVKLAACFDAMTSLLCVTSQFTCRLLITLLILRRLTLLDGLKSMSLVPRVSYVM